MPSLAPGAALRQHLLNPFGGGKARALLEPLLLPCAPRERSHSSEMASSCAVPSYGPDPALFTHGRKREFFQRDFCTLKRYLEVWGFLYFFLGVAIALAAQTPPFLILGRNNTAAHLKQPGLLGLEPPARAGCSLSPFAGLPMDKLSSRDPILRVQGCAKTPAGFIATSKRLVWDSKHRKARANRQ